MATVNYLDTLILQNNFFWAQQNSYRFGTTWGWVMTFSFSFFFGVNYPFNANNKSSISSKSKISQNKTSIPVKTLDSGCDLYFTQSSFWGSINTVYSGPLKLDLLSKDCSEASHSSRPWIREQILDLCISTHCLHNRYQNTPWKQTIKHKHTQSTSHGLHWQTEQCYSKYIITGCFEMCAPRSSNFKAHGQNVLSARKNTTTMPFNISISLWIAYSCLSVFNIWYIDTLYHWYAWT